MKRLRKLINDGLKCPKKMALGITLAVLLGLFPFFVLPTLVIVFLSIRLRISMAMMITFNYLVCPLQILLFMPYIHLGNFLFGGKATNVSFSSMCHAFKTNMMQAIKSLGAEVLLAVGAWAVTGIIAGILLYIGLNYTLTNFAKGKRASSPRPLRGWRGDAEIMK